MSSQIPIYLCYDLKGIQSFIFAVPKLKYICGGSALIDRFDREKTHEFLSQDAELLFAGGGKGAYRCTDANVAEILEQDLVKAAHADGLTISFGMNVDYSEAAQLADRSYPYLPGGDELEGQPCVASGLYPVPPNLDPHGEGVHPKIELRNVWGKVNLLSRRAEEEILPESEQDQYSFFHNVSAEDPQSTGGPQGAAALGNRNRWAIIAMDGNDMGVQHREATRLLGDTPEKYHTWLRRMSQSLDHCSRKACRQAVENLKDRWEKDVANRPKDQKGRVILPIRPLLVGGDDILVLCHCDYAMSFVQDVCESFKKISQDCASVAAASEEQIEQLWPATGNKLSISAGILFAPVSLPLSTAIGFAESLLSSAKSVGRKHPEGEAAPECLDWESVTEGVLRSPAERREREFIFRDSECNATIQLTKRPMKLEAFSEVTDLMKRYREIPGTIRHQILPGMQKGFFDRKVFLARLGKNHPNLVHDLSEGETPTSSPKGKWDDNEGVRSTPVIDALLLLEEETRMKQETV